MDIMESSVIASVDTVDITQHATMLLEHVFLDVNLGIKHQTVQKIAHLEHTVKTVAHPVDTVSNQRNVIISTGPV